MILLTKLRFILFATAITLSTKPPAATSEEFFPAGIGSCEYRLQIANAVIFEPHFQSFASIATGDELYLVSTSFPEWSDFTILHFLRRDGSDLSLKPARLIDSKYLQTAMEQKPSLHLTTIRIKKEYIIPEQIKMWDDICASALSVDQEEDSLIKADQEITMFTLQKVSGAPGFGYCEHNARLMQKYKHDLYSVLAMRDYFLFNVDVVDKSVVGTAVYHHRRGIKAQSRDFLGIIVGAIPPFDPVSDRVILLPRSEVIAAIKAAHELN